MPRTLFRRGLRLPATLLATVAILATVTAPAHAADPHGGGDAVCHEPSGVACPPRIGHVWTIVLENSGVYTSFGLGQLAAPYLARDLPSQGAFVPNYYGTGHSSLDNYIAMISGQGPNSETQGDCTDPSQLGAGDPGYTIDGAGQAVGTVGCTYQRDVPNIASQLRASERTWKSYNETMDAHPGVNRTHCQGPDTYAGGRYAAAPDPYADPRTASQPNPDEYRAKHNPFVYFHDITDDLDYCDTHDVPLGSWGPGTHGAAGSYDRVGTLRNDLAHERTTPAYSFITPNQCSDGHDDCTSGTPGSQDPQAKLAQMDEFLKLVVPMIQASPAYRDPRHPGLIVITFDEGTDSAACCDEQQPSAELSHEGSGGQNGNPFGPGGGVVGAVLLSPAIKPGTVSTQAYNHYSYLRTVEDVFSLSHLGYAGDAAYPTGGAASDPGGALSPGGPPRPFGPDIFTNASA